MVPPGSAEAAKTLSPAKKLSYKVPPWQHQAVAIERAAPADHFAFLFEVGTGKSAAAIHTLRHKYVAAGRVMRTLILTPAITLENWRREWFVHSEVRHTAIDVLTGTGVERELSVLEHMKSREPANILITNYETLLMPKVLEALMAWGPEILLCDEAHRLKNIEAKRTKAAIKIADKADVRLLLTGTPILNSPLDLFAQWRILDRGETFGQNLYAFRAEYFWDRNAGMPRQTYFPDWIPKTSCYARLRAKIEHCSMSVKKVDCLDLPPLVKRELPIALAPEQRRLYNEMKRDFIAFVKRSDGRELGVAVATLALTKALRLMEICSGFVTTEGEDGGPRKKRTLTDNPRAAALKELLEDLGAEHKIIVWAVFKENYQTIRDVCDAVGLPYVEVHGDVSAKRKQEAVDTFNNDPRCRVFLGHPRSGGIGINLVASDISIVYSRTFSLEDDVQAEARNYRGGSEIHAKVTRIDLIAAGTIDEEIALRLRMKQAVGAKVLCGMVDSI